MRTDARVGALEVRHFFSGAAMYRQGEIVASLTPVGLGLPVEVRSSLLKREIAVPLRYFPNSPIKSEYVLFPDSWIDPGDAIHLLLGDDLPG